MRDILKRLSKMVVGYGAIQWAGPLLSFLLFPIITRILDVSDYGTADVILALAAGMAMLATFAQPNALSTHFNDQPNINWKRQVVGGSLLISLTISVLLGASLVVVAPTLAQVYLKKPEYTWLLQVIGASLVCGACASVVTATAQAQLRVRWGMALSLTTVLTTVAGNVLLVLVLRLGGPGLVLTSVLTACSVSVVGLILVRKQIAWPNPAIIRILFISGLTILPAFISSWALQLADRFFLLHYLSGDVLTSMGYYATANRIASLLGVAMAPLYAAWTPLALAMQHEAAAKQRHADMSRYLIAIVLVAALGLGLFSTEILLVLARPTYLPAAPYVGFLAYVQVFSAFGTVLATGALAAKQLTSWSGAVIIGAIVNLFLNYLLIPIYGVWGATISTVVSYGVPQVFLYFWLRNRYPVPYPVGRLLSALGVQILLLTIGILLPPLNFPIRILIKLLLMASLVFALFRVELITKFEAQQGWLFIRNQWHLRFG